MNTMIRPLDKVTSKKAGALYGQIFDRIREWIRIGKLKEGDLLPSERDLAAMFDVSRVPVREALKVLEFVGVVQHVHGKGVFVRKITVNNIIDNIDFVMMDPKHTIIDIFEVREGNEIHAAYLAAERWNDEDLRNIEASLEVMEKKNDKGELILEPSMDFHSAVIAASHNAALADINKFLTEWLIYFRKYYMYTPDAGEKGLHDHRELYELISKRDSIGASRKMMEHLSRAKAKMMSSLLENPDTGSVADRPIIAVSSEKNKNE